MDFLLDLLFAGLGDLFSALLTFGVTIVTEVVVALLTP